MDKKYFQMCLVLLLSLLSLGVIYASEKGSSSLFEDENESDFSHKNWEQMLREEQENDDWAIALAFEASDNHEYRSSYAPIRMPDALKEMFATYDARFAKIEKVMDMNVHAFNKEMDFKTLVPILEKHDTYTKTDIPFAEIKNAILSSSFFKNLSNKAHKNNITKGLTMLQKHIRKSVKETKETNCHVPHLLSRLWSLIHLNDTRNDVLFNTLLMTIADNAATGGGCYPGHAGRLANLYITNSRYLWQEY